MSDSNPPDPVYVHSRREAAVILFIWAACLAWTVGYCWYSGYEGGTGGLPTRVAEARVGKPPVPPVASEPQLVLGLPSWVFWGVLTPWGAAALASIVFAHRVMVLDDLGENEDEPSNA